ncbi:hypothetical protein CYLTODRAFT_423016, partial [Cylindrobasidium torrendii FP15055 ss-10]
MFLPFRLFRKILFGLITLICGAAMITTISIHSNLRNKGGCIIVYCVESALLAHSVIFAHYRVLFGRVYNVGWEIVGIVVLLPFATVLTLCVINFSLISVDDETDNISRLDGALFALQLLVIVHTIIWAIYALCFVLVSVSTLFLFDPKVMDRDLESSPSPFPMTFVFRSLCPGLSPGSLQTNRKQHSQSCLPGCACDLKAQPDLELPTLNEMDYRTTTVLSTETAQFSKSSSLAASLVRVPNDVERRSSIALTLENARSLLQLEQEGRL